MVAGTAAGVPFKLPVTLNANEDRSVVVSAKEFPQLKFHNPKVWWPRQMGEPHLEKLTVSFLVGGQMSDQQTVKFGFREMSSELTAINGGRMFRVNGKRLLIRGGAWTQDVLLRQDDKRLADQFDLIANMNLNLIRLEGKLEPEEFFRVGPDEAAAILVMAGWSLLPRIGRIGKTGSRRI